MTQTLSIVCIG